MRRGDSRSNWRRIADFYSKAERAKRSALQNHVILNLFQDPSENNPFSAIFHLFTPTSQQRLQFQNPPIYCPPDWTRGRSSVVECHLAKVNVESSNLFARSNSFTPFKGVKELETATIPCEIYPFDKMPAGILDAAGARRARARRPESISSPAPFVLSLFA